MNGNTAGKFIVGSIIIFLVLFGIALLILNNMQSVYKVATAPESMEADAVAERIKPVAEVTVGEPPKIEAPAANTGGAAGGPGKDIVDAVCATCHASGLMNAPKLGSKEDWAPRLEKGMDTLHKHALEGFNAMPAKGGRGDLPDADVEAAVDYMISLVQEGGGEAAAPAAETAPAAEAAPAQDEAAMTVGKDTVEAVCATCHASGLMNAPKIGDAESWAPHLEKGIDTLHQHALEGFNAMPAKGGRTDLPDSDVIAAVDYMVSLVQSDATPAAAPAEEPAAEKPAETQEDATPAEESADAPAASEESAPAEPEAAPAADDADAAAPAQDEAAMTVGKDTVDAVCATCHASGLMNAPKIGNAEDWAPRIEKGIETLHKHAIEGFNTMPAKGGRTDLPDADVEAAVDYMVHMAQ